VAGTVQSLAFYPDGQRLIFMSTTGDAEVWHVAGGQRIFSFGQGRFERPDNLGVLALSADGVCFATQAARSTGVTLWDTANGSMMVALPAERSTVWPLAWSPNRELLAIGLSDGGLVIWNVPQTRSQLARIGLDW
jgi:WD40 repeat protein